MTLAIFRVFLRLGSVDRRHLQWTRVLRRGLFLTVPARKS